MNRWSNAIGYVTLAPSGSLPRPCAPAPASKHQDSFWHSNPPGLFIRNFPIILARGQGRFISILDFKPYSTMKLSIGESNLQESKILGWRNFRLGRKSETGVGGRTNCLNRRKGLVFQEHKISRLYITVQNFLGVALSYRPQHSPHIAGNLQHKGMIVNQVR
jgi:hypothetical protein